MSETDFLFARPSFYEGMARVVDIGGTLNVYNESTPTALADNRALQNDFRMIGQDMQSAFNNHEKEQKKKRCRKKAKPR